jgi:hypothetical protein
MTASVREYEPFDEEPVVGLSLRAWELVFALRGAAGAPLMSRRGPSAGRRTGPEG